MEYTVRIESTIISYAKIEARSKEEALLEVFDFVESGEIAIDINDAHHEYEIEDCPCIGCEPCGVEECFSCKKKLPL